MQKRKKDGNKVYGKMEKKKDANEIYLHGSEMKELVDAK
jgi:hypothetical protein